MTATTIVREWCAYIRVSEVGDRGGESFISPDLQRTALVHLSPAIEFSDIDRTGRNFDRPGIAAAMAWVMEKPATRGIAVYNLSRLGRNTADSLRLTNKVTAAGAAIYSSAETVDTTTTSGQFALRLWLSLAELQSDQISDSWKAVHGNRLKRGLPTSGRPRFGYYREQTADGRWTGPYLVDPTTGPVLRETYLRSIKGAGFLSLVRSLNVEGVKSTEGMAMNTRTLRSVLDSGFGAGLILTTRTGDREWIPGAHESVISTDEFHEYQRARKSRSVKHPRHIAPKWFLSGIARCGLCGRPLTLSSYADPQAQARCSGRVTDGVCRGISIQRVVLENRVGLWVGGQIEELSRHVSSDAQRGREQADAQAMAIAARDEWDRLEAAQGRLAQGYATGLLDDTGYRIAKVDLTGQQAAARAELDKANDALDALRPMDLDVYDQIARGTEEITSEEWNQLLSKILRSVEVEKREYRFTPTTGEIQHVPRTRGN